MVADSENLPSYFLKQPPRLMGLDNYFMQPTSDENGNASVPNGFTPLLKEVYDLKKTTETAFTTYRKDTISVVTGIQDELVTIRKAVIDIRDALKKDRKEQLQFYEDIKKQQQSLAEKYQKQLGAITRDNTTIPSKKNWGKVARPFATAGSTIASGLFDTLAPGLSKAGVGKFLGSTALGLSGLIFGAKVQKQWSTGLYKSFSKQTNLLMAKISKGFKTTGKGIFDIFLGTGKAATSGLNTLGKYIASGLKGLFGSFGKKDNSNTKISSDVLKADVLDDQGNVVGETTAEVISDKPKKKKGGIFSNMFRKKGAANVAKTAGTGLARTVGTRAAIAGGTAALGGTAAAGTAAAAGGSIAAALPWIVGGAALVGGGTFLGKKLYDKYQRDNAMAVGAKQMAKDPTKKHDPTTMLPSARAIQLIKNKEGFREYVYDDKHPNRPWTPAMGDPEGHLTVGYGTTTSVFGESLQSFAARGGRLTKEQASKLMMQNLPQYVRPITENVKVPLTQGQFDALTSFAYNVGEGNFTSSTLLKKLNKGDYAGAQAEFGRWVHDDYGNVLPGLVSRRKEEASWFGGAMTNLASAAQSASDGLKGFTKNVIQTVKAVPQAIDNLLAIKNAPEDYVDKAMQNYTGIKGAGHSTFKLDVERKAEADKEYEAGKRKQIYELNPLGTEEISGLRGQRYADPAPHLNNNGTVSTADGNIGMLMFMQTMFQQ